MRCRRHINGSSNAAQSHPASAESSPRVFVVRQRGAEPADSSLQGPDSEKPKAVSGAATARRPQTAHLTHELSESSRRRIQSARGENPVCDDGLKQSFEAELAFMPATERILPANNSSSRPSTAQHFSANQRVSAGDNATSRRSHQKVRQNDVVGSLPSAMEHFGAILQDRYDGKRSLRAAFLNWDGDKDGRITRHEMELMMNTLGISQRLGEHKVEAVLHHVSKLPDSCLHYEDFCRLISQRFGEAQKANPTASSACGSSQLKADKEPASSEQALYPNTQRVVELLRSKYHTRKLRSVFRNWDMDKDGCVTMQEFDKNLRRQSVNLNQDQLQELFTSFDTDGNGKLLFQEFVNMIEGPPDKKDSNHRGDTTSTKQTSGSKTTGEYPVLRTSALKVPAVEFVESNDFRASVLSKLRAFAPRLNDAYAAFDDDHSGNLSYLEFRQGLQQVGLHFTEREFFHLATAVDTDGSGEISFKEFCQMFSQGRDGATGVLTWPAPSKAATSHSAGSFDFSHLARRTKIPTRTGKTPYHDTGGVIRHDTGNNCMTAARRFSTESREYGRGQASSSASAASEASIGHEDKQRRNVAHVNRLQRIRTQLESYNAQRAQTQQAEAAVKARHIETLQNQHVRYQAAIDERPRYVRTGGKAAVLSRENNDPTHGIKGCM